MRRMSSLVAAAALAAAASGLSVAVHAGPRIVNSERVETRAERRQNRQAGSGNPFGLRRRLGPGWSDRHVQRMAAKRRAVRRHRAATRGRA